MMFAYLNNGLSFRAVDPDYTAQEGELLFSDYATPNQLTAAFSGYAAAAASLSVRQQIDALEASVTPRMTREAISGSTTVFPTGTTYAGLTSAQALAQIETQIVALRASLAG